MSLGGKISFIFYGVNLQITTQLTRGMSLKKKKKKEKKTRGMTQSPPRVARAFLSVFKTQEQDLQIVNVPKLRTYDIRKREVRGLAPATRMGREHEESEWGMRAGFFISFHKLSSIFVGYAVSDGQTRPPKQTHPP